MECVREEDALQDHSVYVLNFLYGCKNNDMCVRHTVSELVRRGRIGPLDTGSWGEGEVGNIGWRPATNKY